MLWRLPIKLLWIKKVDGWQPRMSTLKLFSLSLHQQMWVSSMWIGYQIVHWHVRATVVYFSEHCWPWSLCKSIIYRLGILNQVRNVAFSLSGLFHLSGHLEISRDHRDMDSRGSTVHVIVPALVAFPPSNCKCTCMLAHSEVGGTRGKYLSLLNQVLCRIFRLGGIQAWAL